MSILVCGGAGYIGSHTVHQLVKKGEDVVIVDNLQTGHLGAVNPKAKFYKGDIREAADMADRRDYSGRRGGMPYRPVPYGQRESAPKAAGGMLPLQIFICAVFLLCLLSGWLLDAQWFADGKQLLLAQINAADQTQQVETILSGVFRKQESNGQVPATSSDAATLTP